MFFEETNSILQVAEYNDRVIHAMHDQAVVERLLHG
jgi:hypothetical protein